MKITFRRLWQILCVVAILMLCVGMATDTSDVERYRHQMERLMATGDYEAALKVGEESDKTDAQLTKLRVEALHATHQLGERLFTYPIKGNGQSFRNRGWDYALVGLLIDRDLDGFVKHLPKYYKIDSHLPRHYREALILYAHQCSNPEIVYRDNVVETDYNDLQELERKYPEQRERKLAVMENYRNTYWYYFDYQR